MKKLISILSIMFAVAFVSAQVVLPRYSTTSNGDNTGRVLTYAYKTPAVYSGTTQVASFAYSTTIKPAAFTSTVTPVVTANVSTSYADDRLTFIFSTSSTGSVVVTFATNFLTTATVAITPSKTSVITFVFNGAKWVEVSRAVNQ